MAINPSYIPFIYCVVIFATLVSIVLLCKRMYRIQGRGIDANLDVRQHEGGSQGGEIHVGVTTHNTELGNHALGGINMHLSS